MEERVVIGDDESVAIFLEEYCGEKDCYRLFSDISAIQGSAKIRILSKEKTYVGMKELLSVVRKGRRVIKVLHGSQFEFWELEKNK